MGAPTLCGPFELTNAMKAVTAFIDVNGSLDKASAHQTILNNKAVKPLMRRAGRDADERKSNIKKAIEMMVKHKWIKLDEQGDYVAGPAFISPTQTRRLKFQPEVADKPNDTSHMKHQAHIGPPPFLSEQRPAAVS